MYIKKSVYYNWCTDFFICNGKCMKYKTEEEKKRKPYFDQNYGTAFNMERLDFLIDQLRIIYKDLPKDFFHDKKIYESFDLLRGHLYSFSLENRFKLTTRELNRMRKTCELSHAESLSQFIRKDKFYIVPDKSELSYNHVSKVERYKMDLLHGAQESCYLKKAFHNMEYMYAVGDYAVMYSLLLDAIMEDINFESKVISGMTNTLFLWGITTCQSANIKLLPFAVMSKDQSLIDRAMIIIGKDRFISLADGLNYGLTSNLIPMGKEQESYVNAKHENELRRQINEYYGIS